jgi:signal peptidase I
MAATTPNDGTDALRERIERRRKDRSATATPPAATQTAHGFLHTARGYLDALVFAYLLAMFIRSFVFELFMIPTGSMTPTLIGDSAGEVAMVDYDGDGTRDVVYAMAVGPHRNMLADYLQIYLMNPDNTYKDLIFLLNVPQQLPFQLIQQSQRRKDMIIVSKFAYWFRRPDRGEIAVFKVPDRVDRESPFEPAKPVFIKRVVGLPGETIDFLPPPTRLVRSNDPKRYSTRWGGNELHIDWQPLLANGEPVRWPGLEHLRHYPRPEGMLRYPTSDMAPNREIVPPDGVLMVGDNPASSSDGRYWGSVPLDNLRGRAVLRYWPLSTFTFFH